jgi:hypothetical protein
VGGRELGSTCGLLPSRADDSEGGRARFEVGAVLESGKTLSGAAMRIRITAPFALLRPTLVSPLGEALRISST